MAIAKRDVAALANVLSTSAYGGVEPAIGATELFSVNIDLETNGYEGTHIFVNYTCDSSTDNCVISFYGSIDGSTYTSIADLSQEFNNSEASARASIVIRDLLNFRIGVKSAAGTDTYDWDIDHKAWRWDVT